MTNILHIETATKACSVALSKHGVCLEVKESLDEQFSHGEQLTLYIQEILENNGLKPTDLNAVSVTSGPGSYTGLRIGVSTAKGLCFALGIPLIVIDSLRNLAELAKEKHPKRILCPMIDARRMEVYNAIYNDKIEMIKSISADVIDEDSYKEYGDFVSFGDGAEKVQELWKGRNIIFDDSIYCSAKGHSKLAYDKFVNNKFEDVAYFEPFYLKDFVGGKKKST